MDEISVFCKFSNIDRELNIEIDTKALISADQFLQRRPKDGAGIALFSKASTDLWSKMLSAPFISRFWKQLIGSLY